MFCRREVARALRLDDVQHRHPSTFPVHGPKRRGEGEAETEAGRHAASEGHGAAPHGKHSPHESHESHERHEKAEAGEAHSHKKDQQHRRDDAFDRHGSPVSQGEKEGLKTNPELKNRQAGNPRPVDPANQLAKKSEHDKRDERLDSLSVPNSVFGRDRVTISPEAQVVPAVSRKSEAVGVKKQRQKYLPPGLNTLAAKANPAKPAFKEFLDAFVKNYIDEPAASAVAS